MNRLMRFIAAVLWLGLIFSCSDDWKRKDEVSGDGLKRGTTYEMLLGRGNYSIFLNAVDRIGYSDLLNGKGLSTVFAPDDEAFGAYFKTKGIRGLEDIRTDSLEQLIGFHILRFGYRMKELTDFQTNPGVAALPGINFKFETVVTPMIRDYYSADVRRDVKVFSRARYLPVFTANHFGSLKIGAEANYQYFYPNSTWNGEKGISVSNAQVLETEIPTDNGYLYTVNQVVEPLKTVYEVMESDPDYSIIKNIYDRFVKFTYDKAISQRYAEAGDSLFLFGVRSTRNFPVLSLGDQWTSNGVWESPQFGDSYNAFLPNNQAMEKYFQEYWRDPQANDGIYYSYETMDRLVLYYLFSNHILLSSPAYPDRVKNELRNSWGYNYEFDPEINGMRREFCANGVFIGIDKVEEPAIFRSVTRPVFQSASFRIFSYILAKSGLLTELANQTSEVTLFIPNDDALAKAGYTIYDPQSELENVQVRLNGTNQDQSKLTSFVYAHMLDYPLGETELDGSDAEWKETRLSGSFMKVGNGRLVLENQQEAQVGDRFTYNPVWRAYEVKSVLSAGASALIAAIEATTPYNYRGWWKTPFKEYILKKTNYFNGDGKPLTPFVANRGVMFIPHNSWVKSLQNDVPYFVSNTSALTNPQKVALSQWLDKHVLTVEENPGMKLVDFIEGNLVGKSFVIHSAGMQIKVVDAVRSSDAVEVVPGEKETSLGDFKLTIEVTAPGKQTHTAVAYGPHFASDCVTFVIRRPEDRFVYAE